MFLSPSYKTIELLPIVESLFDLGQKGFRQWAKRLSTLVDNKKEYKMSFNILKSATIIQYTIKGRFMSR